MKSNNFLKTNDKLDVGQVSATMIYLIPQVLPQVSTANEAQAK